MGSRVGVTQNYAWSGCDTSKDGLKRTYEPGGFFKDKPGRRGCIISVPSWFILPGLIGMLRFQRPNLIFPGLGKPERMICTHYYT